MALRDKLFERSKPYLQAGEQVQAIFMAQAGPSPYWSLLSYWITLLGNNYVIIVVTNQSVLVLQAGRFTPSKPKALLLRGDRNITFGPQKGLWGQIQLDRRYWVHKRFHKDVVAADAALHGGVPGQHG